MKNIITTIYITIVSILFITVLFTIAELNIIAKSPFNNQLEQSVVMNASYLITCKLIIQIVLTYVFGNMLYNKIKYIHDSNIKHAKAKESWEQLKTVMTSDSTLKEDRDKIILGKTIDSTNRDDLSFMDDILDKKKSSIPNLSKELDIEPKFNFGQVINNNVDKEYNKVNTLQFDPIDQVDELDKNNIPSVNQKDGINDNGVLLSDLLIGIPSKTHTFDKRQIKENKRWRQIYNIGGKEYEVIIKDRKNQYYVEVEDVAVLDTSTRGIMRVSDIINSPLINYSFTKRQVVQDKRYTKVELHEYNKFVGDKGTVTRGDKEKDLYICVD